MNGSTLVMSPTLVLQSVLQSTLSCVPHCLAVHGLAVHTLAFHCLAVPLDLHSTLSCMSRMRMW